MIKKQEEIKDLENDLWLEERQTKKFLELLDKQMNLLIGEIATLSEINNSDQVLAIRNRGVALATLRKVINYARTSRYDTNI